MTTLSLFDDTATLEPVTVAPAAAPAAHSPGDEAVRGGGLTLPVLAFAALVASPAIWQCLVRHDLPVHVMLERYVVIALGCLLVSEVARRLLPTPAAAPDTPADVIRPGGPDDHLV